VASATPFSSRDQYEKVREWTAARMVKNEPRTIYRQRPRIAETPFGILKPGMGRRQSLLRGLEKAKTEKSRTGDCTTAGGGCERGAFAGIEYRR
jgi:hypothetical protein